MPAAAAAEDVRPLHQQAAVGLGDDRIGERSIEARPARAAVELGRRAEKRKAASRTVEQALAMLLVERTGIGPLGARLAQDMIALRSQNPPPLSGGLGQWEAG